jgi:hypothetical protein
MRRRSTAFPPLQILLKRQALGAWRDGSVAYRCTSRTERAVLRLRIAPAAAQQDSANAYRDHRGRRSLELRIQRKPIFFGLPGTASSRQRLFCGTGLSPPSPSPSWSVPSSPGANALGLAPLVLGTCACDWRTNPEGNGDAEAPTSRRGRVGCGGNLPPRQPHASRALSPPAFPALPVWNPLSSSHTARTRINARRRGVRPAAPTLQTHGRCPRNGRKGASGGQGWAGVPGCQTGTEGAD